MNRRHFNSALAGGAFHLWLQSDLDAQTCGPLPPASSAMPFQIPANLPVVPRPSVIELAKPERAGELNRLRQAVQAMKALTPATNPLRYSNQVNLHCNHCGVPSAEIHFNWQFIPWHRAMLFFHERILNKLVPTPAGQPPIRIPYWPWDDWNTAANRSVPAIYTVGSLNAVRNPVAPLTQSQVSPQSMLILNAASDFIGTPTSASANFSGPHANVHDWANNLSGLSSLRYSPSDPLFYAHHANIDRVWSSWIALGNGRTNPDFGQLKAYFFDENGVWRSILLNDMRSEATLGYKYSSLISLQSAPAPSPLSVTMSSNQISDVNDAASAFKRTSATTLLLRGLKLGALSKESRFAVFVDAAGDNSSVSSPNFLGRFSTIEPVNGEPPGGLTVAIPAEALRSHLTGKPKLLLRALDPTGKTKGTGIPIAAASVSLL